MTDDKWKQHGHQHLGFAAMVTANYYYQDQHALYYVITQMAYSMVASSCLIFTQVDKPRNTTRFNHWEIWNE